MAASESSAVEQPQPVQSTSNICDVFESDNTEPAVKKQKVDSIGTSVEKKCEDKLEMRLNGILCCVVCLDLPKSAIYQCNNGHLMCAGCFTHLLADARLKDETASCPNCRCEISKNQCSRNLAVEKAVCELPTDCQYCSKELPRTLIEHHQAELCVERLMSCQFERIGCGWRGPFHELKEHQIVCIHPQKSGAEVMEALKVKDKSKENELNLFHHVFDLLSYEKINFSDLQLKPYRTDEFIHKLFYETSRFSAFNQQWVVKATINDNQRDPSKSCCRSISYQLVLKSRISSPFAIHYVVLKGPFGDMKVHPRIYHHEFDENKLESTYQTLPLSDSNECNRLLAMKAVSFRLIMFQVLK
ncbi:Cysteine and histidine-rich protein 1 [Nymphon striatum]|nr:Cysteine and histidine-rich protein 1 [Nymphon striatum]